MLSEMSDGNGTAYLAPRGRAGCTITACLIKFNNYMDNTDILDKSPRFAGFALVCTENLIRVDEATESPKLAQ